MAYPQTITRGRYTITLHSANKATVEGGVWDGIPWSRTIKELTAGGDSNPKTALNSVETIGLSMAPHDLSGLGSLCSMATTCIHTCLDETGKGPISNTKIARIARAVLWIAARDWCVQKLKREIASARAGSDADVVGIRPNMFSDNVYEKTSDLIDTMPKGVIAYDYTKIPRRFRGTRGGWVRENYRLTYSYDGTAESAHAADWILETGANVSVVFYDENCGPATGRYAANQKLPKTWTNPISGKVYRVIDGTASDWRPDDPDGVIVGLKLKSLSKAKRAAAIESGFAQNVDGSTLPLVGHHASLSGFAA